MDLFLKHQDLLLHSRQLKSQTFTWTVDDDRLARTIEILGDFPPELLQKGSKAAEFFNTNGNALLFGKRKRLPISFFRDFFLLILLRSKFTRLSPTPHFDSEKATHPCRV